MLRSVLPNPFVLLSVIFLAAACQSGEERAESHYQNALQLMEAGDFERAAVEFRNVFDHNGLHREAREAFAAMLRREGEPWEAYSQYLRLVEQYPDHLEGRTALAEMALDWEDWDEARRHGQRAIAAAPDAPASRVIAVNLAYLDALEAEDEPARRAAHDRIAALLQEDPENRFLLRPAVDSLERDGALEAALEHVQRALAVDPENWTLHETRLRLLSALEREDAFEAAFLEMIAVFPDEEELPVALLRFYLATDQADAAQTFLRDRAAAAATPGARDEALLALVRLKLETDGREAALAELDAIIADHPEAGTILRTLRASLRFDAGEQDPALAELQALLQTEGLGPADAGRIRVALAQMRLARGEAAEARQLVETVLEEDRSQIQALKMLAAWLIEEDEADRAIARLRTALEGNPDDIEALTLMAEAHFRNGNRPLGREFLALAVEASGSAPAETLRYVAVLLEDDRFILAEELVIDALRTSPGQPELLLQLGEIYLRIEDWTRAEQVERSLRAVGTPEALARADSLHAAILAARGQSEQALAFLEDLAARNDGADLSAQLSVVRARLAMGETARALSFAQDLLAEAPEDPARRLTVAAVQSAAGGHGEAEALYRGLVEDDPGMLQAWIGLIRALGAQGRPEEAAAVLQDALRALPDAPDLLWIEASQRERAGDFEGAIAIYERLYAVLPNAPVVANNLASLISTARSDEDSLARAYTIARRLRGSDVPQFQDTFGWIAHRRGEHQEALEHLEPAAAALPKDPLVQFHLGMTYLALGRRDAALDRLRLAVDLAGPDDSRPQFRTARAEIATLEAAAAEGGPEGGNGSGSDE